LRHGNRLSRFDAPRRRCLLCLWVLCCGSAGCARLAGDFDVQDVDAQPQDGGRGPEADGTTRTSMLSEPTDAIPAEASPDALRETIDASVCTS
jgi:hypothetical protein